MIVFDSSAWIEMSLGTRLGEEFAKMSLAEPVAIPSLAVYEILRQALRFRPDQVDVVEMQLRRCAILDLTSEIARVAAELSIRHSLAMADAIVYATAQAAGVKLAACDAHFQGLPGVVYRKKS